MVYLVVKDEVERGVYSFSSRSVAEDLASNFKNYIFLHEGEEDKAKALVGAEEITDAIFLIRKYRSKKKPRPSTVDTPIKDVTSESNFLKIVTHLKKQGAEAVKISMANGEDYIISLTNVFYTTEEGIQSKFMFVQNNQPEINAIVVDAAISNGQIAVLRRSTFDKIGDFIVLNSIDDDYQPNPVEKNDKIFFKHVYSKVIINPTQIVAFTPVEAFKVGKTTLRAKKLTDYLETAMNAK